MPTPTPNARTTQRPWHTLKAGDTVFFATGWYEVLDAYAIAKNALLVKLALDEHRIQAYRVRVAAGSEATCLA